MISVFIEESQSLHVTKRAFMCSIVWKTQTPRTKTSLIWSDEKLLQYLYCLLICIHKTECWQKAYLILDTHVFVIGKLWLRFCEILITHLLNDLSSLHINAIKLITSENWLRPASVSQNISITFLWALNQIKSQEGMGISLVSGLSEFPTILMFV